MSQIQGIFRWLAPSVSESKTKRYTHRLLQEDPAARAGIMPAVRSYVQAAHEDARRHLRDLAAISLEPLGGCSGPDPAAGYPECLDPQTLKGYAGEIFAGIVLENFSPFGDDDWCVPAFLFRFHQVAFDQLEMLHQIGAPTKKIPGRTGDDCLGFKRDTSGTIVRGAVCESKCTSGHDTHLISDAHKELSESNLKPVSLRQLIDILRERDDAISAEWVMALRKLWLNESDSQYERCDLVTYVCGQFPVKDERKAWLPVDEPRTDYTGGRRLEAVEIHVGDVDRLIEEIYDRKGASYVPTT